jgi:hypothetical protein
VRRWLDTSPAVREEGNRSGAGVHKQAVAAPNIRRDAKRGYVRVGCCVDTAASTSPRLSGPHS